MEYSSSEADESIENLTDLDEQEQEPTDQQFPNQEDPNNSLPTELSPNPRTQIHQEPYIGMEFESDSAARSFYNSYALKLGFGIRVARSRTERRKGTEVLVMKRFVCLKEGHHKKKLTPDPTNKKKRKRLSIREGCPALLEVVRRGPERWVVSKLVLDHTHVVISPDSVHELQLSRLSDKYKERENYLRDMRIRVFGETGDSQVLLDYFKRRQSENPGFCYAVRVDTSNCITNAVWVDAKSRVSYTYFGDAVTFDTSYAQNKNMMIPFAAFNGVNHHGEIVTFGCALVMDNCESSLVWIFETWIGFMCKKYPISITTDQGRSMERAIAKVFPDTSHRFCRWRIFSRCKKRLENCYSRFPNLHREIKTSVNESDTIDMFEIYWGNIIDKYDLRENEWLVSLYEIRTKWVPAYLTASFFAELASNKKLESVNRFYRTNFGNSKTSLMSLISKFDESMEERQEKEARSEITVLPLDRVLKTDMIIEKQAASLYTREAFETFQLELVESLHHYPVKIQDGSYSKYSVERVGDTRNRHTVYFNSLDKKAWCNCCRFALSGILCRHVLGVFFVTGVMLLPDHCITRRWTRKAKVGPEPDERDPQNESICEGSPVLRYNDLVRDIMKFVEKGAINSENFRVVTEILRKALAEIGSFEEKFVKFRTRQ